MTEWSIIETFAVLVENLAYVYFLNSRFTSKQDSPAPQILVWLLLCAFGLCVSFTTLPAWLYDSSGALILLAYLCVCKHGLLWQKMLGVLLTHALIISSSVLGAGMASVLTDVSVVHTLLYQDTSRLLAIILIKAIQVTLFFVLAKKHIGLNGLKKTSTLLFIVAILIVFASIAAIFAGIDDFDLEGIQHVDSIVAKYQGHIMRGHRDGVFETHIMIPLVSAQEERAT